MMETILRPLVLDEDVKARVAEIRKKAENNPVPWEQLSALASAWQPGEPPPSIGERIDIPQDWVCYFSIRETPSGFTRNLSVSSGIEGKYPRPEGIQMIMSLLGFLNLLTDCWGWPDINGTFNVLEPLDGDIEAFKVRVNASKPNKMN